jgi:glycosyltransferase involved in cell wall biosynthesis
MKLVIVSNMAHYRRADGTIVGHGATARELSVLATLFDEVRHVACLHDETPPASALPYTAENIELVPVPPTGGATIGAKLDIVRMLPHYAATIRRELHDADAVHVRCPDNVSMCALAILSVTRTPRRRWIKYAGNWQPVAREPLFYGLQRRWLARGRHHAQVTVNAAAEASVGHVHAVANPCLTDDEIVRGSQIAAHKALSSPVRLLFVGHLGAAKNPQAAIDAVALLRDRGIATTLDVAGEAADLEPFRVRARALDCADTIVFHGALPRERLDPLYASANLLVLPSRTEGWPKVLSEGMAFGAVPIATAVGSIESVLSRAGCGRALPPPVTSAAIADAITDYVRDPERYRREVARAVAAAEGFSFARYLETVRMLLELPGSCQ